MNKQNRQESIPEQNATSDERERFVGVVEPYDELIINFEEKSLTFRGKATIVTIAFGTLATIVGLCYIEAPKWTYAVVSLVGLSFGLLDYAKERKNQIKS